MSSSRVKEATEFEQLVAHIEEALDKDAKVEHNVKIRDKVTGHLRQVDVVIRTGKGHREFLTIIECRRHGRKVYTPFVEQVITKQKDLGANKAIIVSSSGFSDPARKKAKYYGIDCLTIQEAHDTDWHAFIPTDVFIHYLLRWSVSSIAFQTDVAAAATLPRPTINCDAKLFTRPGEEPKSLHELVQPTVDLYQQEIFKHIRDGPLRRLFKIHLENPVYLEFIEGKFAIRDLEVVVEFVLDTSTRPTRSVKKRLYRDDTSGELLAQVVDMELELDNQTIEVVFIHPAERTDQNDSSI